MKNFQKFFKKSVDSSCKILKIVYPIVSMNVNCFMIAVVIRLMRSIFNKTEYRLNKNVFHQTNVTTRQIEVRTQDL